MPRAILAAATMENVTVIGVDTDQYFSLFGANASARGAARIISSAQKRVDAAVELLAGTDLAGDFVGGATFVMDYSNGGVAASYCHAACDRLPEGAWAALEQVEIALGTGALATNVNDATGRLVFADEVLAPANRWLAPWASASAPPSARLAAASATLEEWGETICYVFGGVTADGAIDGSLWAMNYDGASFLELTARNLVKGASPPARFLSSLAPLSGAVAPGGATMDQLLLFGGLGGAIGTTRFDDVWVFTPWQAWWPVFAQWTNITNSTASGPGARSAHAAAGVAASVYIYGGRSEYNLLGDLWRIDVTSATVGGYSWTPLCSTCLPGALERATLTAMADDATLYLFGGADTSGAVSSALHAFNTASATWTTLTASPDARAQHGAAALALTFALSGEVETALAVVGGLRSTGAIADEILVYVPSAAAWFELGGSAADDGGDDVTTTSDDDACDCACAAEDVRDDADDGDAVAIGARHSMVTFAGSRGEIVVFQGVADSGTLGSVALFVLEASALFFGVATPSPSVTAY